MQNDVICDRIVLNSLVFLYLQRDEEFDVRLLIHQSLAGCVIGKGGQKIKEIRDVSTNVGNVGNDILPLLYCLAMHIQRYIYHAHNCVYS